MQLSEMHIDYIKELTNLGMGEAANELNEIVDEEVQISVPSFEILEVHQLSERLNRKESDNVIAITMQLDGNLKCDAMLIFPDDEKMGLSREDATENNHFTSLGKETLVEIASIIFNQMTYTLSSILEIAIASRLPKYSKSNWGDLVNSEKYKDQKVMFIGISFEVNQTNLRGDMLFMQSASMVEEFIDHVTRVLKEQGYID